MTQIFRLCLVQNASDNATRPWILDMGILTVEFMNNLILKNLWVARRFGLAFGIVKISSVKISLLYVQNIG